MPQVKFDFFQVQISEDSPYTFKETLDSISRLPTEDRIKDIDGSSCFLIQNLIQQRYSAYLFTKIRMDSLPPKTSVTGIRAPLDLDDDEGLGEDVAIAYNETLNIISIQRNRHSLSPNNIIRLIGMIFPEEHIKLLPILRTDALQRFANCNTLKKLRLKLAGCTDLSFLQNSPLSTNDKITFQQIMTEPYVDISFSVGRKNSGLSEKIKSYASFFANLARSEDNDSVLTVEVSGKENDDAPTAVIDLLQDRLIAVEEVNTSNRTIDTNHLMRSAINAIASNYEELQRNSN